MKSNEKTIINDIIKLYTHLYKIKMCDDAARLMSSSMLKMLRHSVEDVENALLDLSSNDDIDSSSQVVRNEILDLTTAFAVQKYFNVYLLPICKAETMDDEKNAILSSISLIELKHLYKIVFGIQASGRPKKIELVYKLKEYFDNLERTNDLTKSFS